MNRWQRRRIRALGALDLGFTRASNQGFCRCLNFELLVTSYASLAAFESSSLAGLSHLPCAFVRSSIYTHVTLYSFQGWYLMIIDS
jgi:hypothetical protein